MSVTPNHIHLDGEKAIDMAYDVLYCIVLYCIYLKGFSKSKWMLITEVSHINIARKMGKWGERRVEDEAWDEGKQVPKYRGIKAGKKSTREEITSADNSGTFRCQYFYEK